MKQNKNNPDTPLMKQYLDVKNQHPGSIVLFRMGDFFETFNEDAKITANILGIVLTKRANGAASEVPLAGFPHHALDNYLPKLVKAGHRVAICEQVEDPKLAKGIVKRKVIEVVTPGTITADQALNEKSNSYIASVFTHHDNSGYAVLDQSTGEFFIGECSSNNLTECLRKFNPKEILVGENITYSTSEWYRELNPFVTQVEDWLFNFDQSHRSLTSHFGTNSLKGFGCEELVNGIIAAGVIFYHIKNDLNGRLEHVLSVRPVLENTIMNVDGFTLRNLEVFQSLSTQGTHGTLLEILDETVTAGGGRLLKQWLYYPLTNISQLTGRHNIVEDLVQNKNQLSTIRNNLKNICDLERILGKISRLKVNPREVLSLGLSLGMIPIVQAELKKCRKKALGKIAGSFVNTNKIVKKINVNLKEDAPGNTKQGGYISDGIDKELDELRSLSIGGKQWMKKFQESERKSTEIPSLKIGFNKVFGYYIDVTKTHQHKVPEKYIRKQTLVNSERYITEELKKYEEKILTAEEKIEAIESRIFDELCHGILKESHSIQTNAKILNRLDLTSSFSTTALKNHYVRPKLTKKAILEIKAGRHPVVEQLIPATDRFIPNDTKMDISSSQIHLITGPNMAGKSTYLRQVGLLVLMSQIGSFIPANKATIGVVDRLFTRVGASDNLAGGESTFLVEMNEAANILNNATPKSLILLDEIGRGTATFDGLSLAWAITEFLHNHSRVGARTLFATHYHELTELENKLKRLKNYKAAVKEFDDKIIFLRTIIPGISDKSYGIHVAQMAGLPNDVIERAKEILEHHINKGSIHETSNGIPMSDQLTLFAKKEQKLTQMIKKIDVNELTPIQALQMLDKLKRENEL